jgi:hypothetical protein
VAVVRSTLELDELWVSEALGAEVAASLRLEVLGPSDELPFDAHGRLSVVAEPRVMAAHVP